MNKKILIGINWFAGGILTLALIFAAFMPQAFLNKENWVQSPVLIIVTIGFLIIILGMRKAVSLMTPRMYKITLIVIGALIFLTQLWVALSFINIARADGYFVREQAISLAQGSHHWMNYFKIYPNNVNTALFEATLLKPFLKLGISNPWVELNLIRFLWIDTGLISGLYILKRWKYWRPAALFLMVTWLFSVPVYSYGLFSYNDPLVMPMALNILALGLVFNSHTDWKKWPAAVLSWVLIAFSVAMKSNLIVLWIAVFLIILIAAFAKKINWKLAIKWILGSVITLVAIFSLASSFAKSNGYVKNVDQSTPVTSWIAMSLNPRTEGQYHGRDFYSVASAKTMTEKKQIANNRIKNRIIEMGPIGLIVHFAEKLGVFISHGDFDGINLNQQWVKAPLGFMNHQSFVRFWGLLLAQCWYLALLCGTIWQLFKKRQHLLLVSFLSLFVLGLTAFHVLFWEVEPRYSLPLLPVIMLLGSIGWSTAPRFVLSTSKRLAVSGLMALGIFFSTLSVIQTVTFYSQQTSSISMQGIGSYFDPTYQQIRPGERYNFDVPVHGHNSDRLSLSTNSSGPVMITIQNRDKVIKQMTDPARFIQEIHYPTTAANKLQVSILNTGSEPVHYISGPTRYSLATGNIFNKPKMNVKWYADQTHRPTIGVVAHLTPRVLDYRTVVIFNATLFLIAILVVTWSRRRTVMAIVSRKRKIH